MFFYFFFNDTATTEIYTLSLHDALPICSALRGRSGPAASPPVGRCCSSRRSRASAAIQGRRRCWAGRSPAAHRRRSSRSEEHTSELQSRQYLVCRLLLEKKKQNTYTHYR